MSSSNITYENPPDLKGMIAIYERYCELLQNDTSEDELSYMRYIQSSIKTTQKMLESIISDLHEQSKEIVTVALFNFCAVIKQVLTEEYNGRKRCDITYPPEELDFVYIVPLVFNMVMVDERYKQVTDQLSNIDGDHYISLKVCWYEIRQFWLPFNFCGEQYIVDGTKIDMLILGYVPT